MIIQKIRLENYRSHKDIEIELSSGVNLILGENGSGKSSILEAIGTVLFAIRDRTGKQKGKQFIKHGEKSAKIEIEFLANDGRSYSVVSSFSKSKTGVNAGKMTLKDVITGEDYSENVLEKLQELCGIKKEYQDIYDQIIVAKQNEFINIFKDSPKNREDTFNKIFNTQIYTEMSDGKSVLKEIEDRYDRHKENLELERNILSSNLQEEDSLLEEWKQEKEKEQKAEEEIKKMEEKKLEIEKKLLFYQKKTIDLENSKKQIENKRENFQEKKKQLKVAIQDGKEAKKSRRLIEENQKSYEEYQDLWEDIEEKKVGLQRLQEQKEQKEKLLVENEKFSWEIAKEEEEMQSLLLAIEEEVEEKIILEEQIQEGLSQEIEWKEKEREYRKGQEKLRAMREEGVELEKTFFALQEKIEERRGEIQEKERLLQGIDRESLYSQMEEIERSKELLEQLRQQKSFAEEKRKLLEDAKEKLEGKFCPLLQETCSNVKNVDVNFYFSDKIEMLDRNLIHLEQETFILLEIVKQERSLQEASSQAHFLTKEIEVLSKKLEEEEISLEKILLEQEKIKLLQGQTLFALSLKDERDLQKKLDEFLVSVSRLQLQEKKKNLEKILKNLQKKEGNKKYLEKQMQRRKLKIEENLRKIDNSIDVQVESMKTFVEELSKKQQELSAAYTLYLENIQRSKSMEESIKTIVFLIESIYIGREEVKELQLRQEHLELELRNFSLEELQNEKIRLESSLLEQSKFHGVIKEKITQRTKALKKLKEEKQKIAELILALRKVGTKLEKTKGIRNAIKNMGVNISKYMLESISQAATYNFRKISGRTEQILWSSEDKDKYGVYLVGKEGQTSFEHLSGGEQVVVAISLRETLTECFSNARFLILDEPTNNLDQERKKLLAEYMAEMLQDLDQSIIVTHDNTFREMAERVIELGH